MLDVSLVWIHFEEPHKLSLKAETKAGAESQEVEAPNRLIQG